MTSRRPLDLEDSAAYMLIGATILGAYRRADGEKELIIAGHTDKGDAFILTIGADYRSVNNSVKGAFVTAVPICGADELERFVYELKIDIDAAEAALNKPRK